MPNALQYVAVQFSPWDRLTYTYHNDGEPVCVGDHVRVDARGEEKTVIVVSISGAAPEFETKPIIGKVEPAEAQAGEQ